MSKVRVHELAKEFGLENKEAIQRLQQGGLSVKTHSSSVYEDEARAIQILLGGLTSANFAATACASVPDCNGSYLPGAELWLAMDLSRERVVDADGFVIGAGERADIQKLHRLAAVAALIAMLLILVKAWREHSEFRGIAITIAILCGAEFVLGVATVLTDLPITIAVAHNWLAALLLLSLLRLISHFRT